MVKEVPITKIVEVEKVVEKIVEKEVPKEVIKEIIKEIPVVKEEGINVNIDTSKIEELLEKIADKDNKDLIKLLNELLNNKSEDSNPQATLSLIEDKMKVYKKKFDSNYSVLLAILTILINNFTIEN